MDLGGSDKKNKKPGSPWVSPFLIVSQWLFLVPLKGGIGGIVHPPIGRYVIPLIYHL